MKKKPLMCDESLLNLAEEKGEKARAVTPPVEQEVPFQATGLAGNL